MTGHLRWIKFREQLAEKRTHGRFYRLLDLCFLGYYQCHSWPYNPVHIRFHVYVINFYMHVLCVNV